MRLYLYTLTLCILLIAICSSAFCWLLFAPLLFVDCFAFLLQDVALASVSMRPIPFAPVLEKLSLSDLKYGSVRRFYIEAPEDNAIPITLQQKMINASPPEKVFRLKGADHSPFFSKPQALHKLLVEISKIPWTWKHSRTWISSEGLYLLKIHWHSKIASRIYYFLQLHNYIVGKKSCARYKVFVGVASFWRLSWRTVKNLQLSRW